MPPCGQCNSGTAETASVLYLTHPVLSRPFLRFLKNFPAAACGRQTLNAQREVARQGRRGSDGSPVRTFGWVPPAGSFLSRQEAPQECGSRGAVGKADELRCDCHRQSFQKPKWSTIPRQCAHWHGICWMRGCFRRKRRNPASLYQVRAGRILKEDGLVCGSKPFSASLSRILAELLGGTRSSPPEAPSRKFR